MLNAFRHHGQGNLLAAGDTSLREVCSTPFGITARGTLTRVCLEGNLECSTPFGITARGT